MDLQSGATRSVGKATAQPFGHPLPAAPPHLAAGEAVMLSIDGHICRLQAVTDAGLVADDPFGHSTLGKGASRGWAGTNVKGDATSNKGEDITWPWSEVEIHAMLWIAWFRA